MGFSLMIPVRIAQFLFALITMGLAGYVFHWYDTETLTNPPSQINFLIAVPVITFISIAYLEAVPRFLPKASHPFAHVFFELINVLFYFAGFIALSVFLSKLLFCRGKVCAAARGADVFAAFSFVLWAGSTALMALELFKGGLAGLKTDRKAEKAMKVEARHGPTATSAV